MLPFSKSFCTDGGSRFFLLLLLVASFSVSLREKGGSTVRLGEKEEKGRAGRSEVFFVLRIRFYEALVCATNNTPFPLCFSELGLESKAKKRKLPRPSPSTAPCDWPRCQLQNSKTFTPKRASPSSIRRWCLGRERHLSQTSGALFSLLDLGRRRVGLGGKRASRRPFVYLILTPPSGPFWRSPNHRPLSPLIIIPNTTRGNMISQQWKHVGDASAS